MCSITTRSLMVYLFFSLTGSHNLQVGLLLIFIIRALLSNPCTVCLLHVCLMFVCMFVCLFVCLLDEACISVAFYELIFLCVLHYGKLLIRF